MADSITQVYRDLRPFLKRAGDYRVEFGLGFLLSMATLIASVGLLALSGWFITATALAGMTVATAQVFNFFTPGAGVRGFSIARTAARYGERLVTHDATFRLLAGLRVWFFRKVEPLAPAGLRKFRQSELLNRLVADIDTMDGLYLRLLSPLLLAVAGSLGLIILACLVSGTVGLFLAVVLGVTLLVLPGLFFRLGQAPGDGLVRQREILRTRLMDFVAGQTELQLFGAIDRFKQQTAEADARVHQQEQAITRVTGFSLAVITLITGLTVSGVLLLGGMDLEAETMNGPLMVMLTLATMAAFEAIAPLPGAFQMLGETHRSAVRLSEVAEQEPAVVFPELETGSVVPSEGRLSLEGVSFAYPNGESVLNDFSLSLEPGERVALKGPTGCGKSTILQLITRDWPCSGQLKLDGQPIDQFVESDLRQRMAVMPQRVHIFSATLRDNLLLSVHPELSINDDVLLSTLKRVGLEAIASTADDLDTWFGAAGQVLSGGEQRRLGMARVLLRLKDSQCRLVLLDEPTEGLDPETERRMIEVLNQTLSGQTLLVVTHRPAILQLVDRILTMG